MDLVGKVLADRYEIREEIGKGGMAQVYKAWCNLLNRYVAIKVLKEEYRDDKEFVHRFNVEAQAAACISNPHVVSIYDVGYQDGFYYIVMEYIEGVILKEYIAKKGPLPWREAASIAAQICEGLAAAHKANVVHRDIKPQNIIMTPEGILKVTDFGIARASSQATTTMGGHAIGTVHYISPEQARGGYTDQRTDIYSLGVVLYEMLTGKMPFVGESPVAVAIKHIQDKPVPLRRINSEIPAAIEAVTLKAMEKEQGARYASAEEFLDDLNQAMKNPGGVENSAIEEDDMGSTIKMESIDNKTIENYEKTRKENKQPERTERKEMFSAKEEREMRELEEKRKSREQKKKDRRITALAILAAVLVVALLGVAFTALTGGFSTGGEKVDIPDLIGMELDKAQREYKDEFSIVMRSEKKSDKKEGIILEQSPDGGDKVSKSEDMIIYVVVSAGEDTLELSSYVEMESEKAQAKVKDDGFQVNVVEQISDSAEKGTVFAQEPAAGATVSKGALVTLYVSKGSEEEEPEASEEPTVTEKPDAPTESDKPVTEPSDKPVQTPAPTQNPGGVTAPGIGD
ncbi:MAG: Stk1 family PASTA domain-containing Ser/Thr kinase [Clostridia bacterium]|nr:Stk1 family PASTA domain-containing Ser/Thr kinase [Clostridia bacterium]